MSSANSMKHEVVARNVKFGGFFAHMKFDLYAFHFCYISIFVDFIPHSSTACVGFNAFK